MSKYIAIIAPAAHNIFAPGTEVFPYNEQNPAEDKRMSYETYLALKSCRTPAFNAVGKDKTNGRSILQPFRFLSEFEIKETDQAYPSSPNQQTTVDGFGRITHFPNSTGKFEEIKYPAGQTYAVCEAVSLIEQRRGSYAVVYGLQIKTGLCKSDAAAEFGECVMHQTECNKLGSQKKAGYSPFDDTQAAHESFA